jgi:hypothetical protein
MLRLPPYQSKDYASDRPASGAPREKEFTLKSITAQRDEAVAGPAGQTTSMRWALAGLSLSMLLSSLGTSIANVA